MVHGAGSTCWGAFLASRDETTVSHVPDAGDETPALQSDKVWQTQCTVSLQPKKQVNISLNSDFNIQSFLGKGKPSDFHCMLSLFVKKKTQLSSTVMTLRNHSKFGQKFHSDCSKYLSPIFVTRYPVLPSLDLLKQVCCSIEFRLVPIGSSTHHHPQSDSHFILLPVSLLVRSYIDEIVIGRRSKYLERNLLHCQFDHFISQVYSEIETCALVR
jgi:hypothetical protein